MPRENMEPQECPCPLRGRVSSQMVTVNLDAVIPTVQDQQLTLGGESDAHRTGEPLSDQDAVAPSLGEVENLSATAVSHDEVSTGVHAHARDAAEVFILREEVADLAAQLPIGAHGADGEAPF